MDDALFVDGSTVEARDVALPTGKKVPLYFKAVRSSVITKWRRLRSEAESKKGDDRDIAIESAQAFLISQSLCDPDGTLISIEKAATLRPAFAEAITRAVLAVNGYIQDDDAKEDPGNG